ncbi:MAG: chloride channel protein, CIC family [Bacteroidetes bacterium]|nr:MAG: chloride channel protein, CIC family [Bacteroidota bacterium]
MSFQSLLNRIYEWRTKHISNRNFLIVASLAVGMVAGIAAIALKYTVHGIQLGLDYIKNFSGGTVFLFLFPIIGILLTVYYVQRFRRGKLGRGVANILYAIAKKSSNVERDKIYSHVISSALTVGFGGSAGLEAPIVVTGAAIGSNTGRDLRLNYKERTVLLAAGAAAGISAVFNSPIAGVIFAVEVILMEIAIPSFIPLLIAAATAAVLSNLLYKGQLFFLITQGWQFKAIPFYILLGILMGLISVYMSRTTLRLETFFKARKKVWQKAIWGGTALGLMIFLLPPLYGEGYHTIENLLQGQYQVIFQGSWFAGYMDSPWSIFGVACVLVLVKVLATALTVGAGGNGGIFAPSLFTGAVTGFLFAYFFNLTGIIELTIPNFIVAGMAGALSGVVHAPMTSIFLIAEVTGGYALFVPLMIVSAFSYFISRYFEPYSIYTKRLAARGLLLTQNKDKKILSGMKIKNLLETDFIPVMPGDTLGQLVETFSHSKRNIFPVLDAEQKLIGLIQLENIREIMFQTELYDTTLVRDLMSKPNITIEAGESMVEVMRKFEEYNTWNIPVIDQGKYLGFLSKSTLLTQYRSRMAKQDSTVA